MRNIVQFLQRGAKTGYVGQNFIYKSTSLGLTGTSALQKVLNNYPQNDF